MQDNKLFKPGKYFLRVFKFKLGLYRGDTKFSFE